MCQGTYTQRECDCNKICETYKRYRDAWKRVGENDQLALDDAGFARRTLDELCPKAVAGGLDR